MNTHPHLPESLADSLSPELFALLLDELEAGNQVAEWRTGWNRQKSNVILLRYPFKVRRSELPTGIAYQEISDPNWWRVEYLHESSRDSIACGF